MTSCATLPGSDLSISAIQNRHLHDKKRSPTSTSPLPSWPGRLDASVAVALELCSLADVEVVVLAVRHHTAFFPYSCKNTILRVFCQMQVLFLRLVLPVMIRDRQLVLC